MQTDKTNIISLWSIPQKFH